ncbi:hypothetical protein ACWDTT_15960 [Streptosporangium sandarakinum]
MKKSDIQTGVAYAYTRKYGRRLPTYVISTGVLVMPNAYAEEGAPLFKKSGATRTSAGYRSTGDVGYPMVQVIDDTPENRQRAASLTLENFMSATEQPKGLHLHVLINLNKVVGPSYDEVVEAERRQKENKLAAAKEREERIRESVIAYNKVVERAQAVGASSLHTHYVGGYYREEIRDANISLKDLEQLVTLAEIARKLPDLRKLMASGDVAALTDAVLDLGEKVRTATGEQPIRHLASVGVDKPACGQPVQIGDVLTSEPHDVTCGACLLGE